MVVMMIMIMMMKILRLSSQVGPVSSSVIWTSGVCHCQAMWPASHAKCTGTGQQENFRTIAFQCLSMLRCRTSPTCFTCVRDVRETLAWKLFVLISWEIFFWVWCWLPSQYQFTLKFNCCQDSMFKSLKLLPIFRIFYISIFYALLSNISEVVTIHNCHTNI